MTAFLAKEYTIGSRFECDIVANGHYFRIDYVGFMMWIITVFMDKISITILFFASVCSWVIVAIAYHLLALWLSQKLILRIEGDIVKLFES